MTEKSTHIVASYTALYLLVVRVCHSEEVRVDGDASSTTVDGRRASREVFGVRVLQFVAGGSEFEYTRL